MSVPYFWREEFGEITKFSFWDKDDRCLSVLSVETINGMHYPRIPWELFFPKLRNPRLFEKVVLLFSGPDPKYLKLLSVRSLDPSVLFVEAAAIRAADGTVFSLPRPNRHSDIIWHMHDLGANPNGPLVEQGFLLSDGRFARRPPAGIVALKAGQCLRGNDQGSWICSTFTSEELW